MELLIGEQYPSLEDGNLELRSWRCNLTALSHVYNLYFVAYNDTVHVHQPHFPDQNLSTTPALIIKPPVSRPGLPHYLDPQTPHSINRLQADYLGHKEILLLCCDDGDVIGYSVSHIHRALEQQTSKSKYSSIDSKGLRPFLHENVGLSAWGLAVHREARLIAISANTHKVTVIAYALTKSHGRNTSGSKSSSADDEAGDFAYSREKNRVFVLSGSQNIPAVSFDNTGADPDGRWLLSCSINGEVHLWDLYHPDSPAQTITMGRCTGVTDPHIYPSTWCTCPDRAVLPHAGETSLFLSCKHVLFPRYIEHNNSI